MNIRYIITILFLSIVLMSCEDVVDIELDEFEPQLVIDAWINNLAEDQVITLSLTQNYFDASFAEKVNDAEVNVVKNNGENLPFIHRANGEYVYSNLNETPIGTIGDAFTLTVNWQGNSYEAVSELNRVPTVDSIDLEFRENETFFDDGYYAQFFARDFTGLGDAYWIKTYKNGIFRSNPREMNIAVDGAFDAGSAIDGIIFIPPIRELVNPVDADFLPIPWEVGEVIKVEIHSMSLAAFQFLEIARDQMINGDNTIFALPVANTVSNITIANTGKSGLGFFNVAAISSLEKTVE